MFKTTTLIQLHDGASSAARKDATAVLAVAGKRAGKRALLEPTLPAVYNGGDLIWHVQFDTKDAQDAFAADKTVQGLLDDPALIRIAEQVSYNGGKSGARANPPAAGIYRTLFLSIRPGISAAVISRFERQLFAMSDYIGAMNRWQLSRAVSSRGTRPWTHVWEQEYTSLNGLTGPYMTHPYHWGYIDRWFDPECADWIVDTFLCHTFCAFSGSIIDA